MFDFLCISPVTVVCDEVAVSYRVTERGLSVLSARNQMYVCAFLLPCFVHTEVYYAM